ncbi:MAG: HD domain-containing protein [Pirellulaceae bacterium]|nr:HD domain-containing protein [Planctomycetaceae bacterium]
MTEVATQSQRDSAHGVRPVAVIDIGATSIRLAIAEITTDGRIRTLETLSQTASLGKDTFTRGVLRKETIEQCVRILKSYRRMISEYQIDLGKDVRAVATSAVREARNRLAFVDRIYIATGLQVQTLDEGEVNRITYLGVLPYLQADETLQSGRVLVVEVGGGSTELIVVRGPNVMFSHTYRLGAMRLRKTLEAYRTPASQVRELMNNEILRTVDEVGNEVSSSQVQMMALGGDMRFATRQLLPEWRAGELARVNVSELERLVATILDLSDDEVVRRYHLTFPEAEIIGPALLSNLTLAQSFGLKEILVTNTNLRDGMLQEMAVSEGWTSELRRQVIRSAVDLARKYHSDEQHALHIAEIAKQLFVRLEAEHQMDQRYETLLATAAILHEIGKYVNVRSYHKHTMYLIRNSELFGLSGQELTLVALIARYHRRASPQQSHEAYTSLRRDQRVAVSKMAALLRLAKALDASRSQRITHFRYQRRRNSIDIHVTGVEDLALEQLALRQSGSLFEEIYGLPVHLRVDRKS